MATEEKILIRGLNWLGDAVMSTPALQRLREAHPKAVIVMLTQDKLADLWVGQPYLNEVVPYSKRATLKRFNFSSGIIFPNSLRSALDVWRLKVPRRIGYAVNGRSLFLTDAVRRREGG